MTIEVEKRNPFGRSDPVRAHKHSPLSQDEADRVLVGLMSETLSADDVAHLHAESFDYIDGFLFSILAAFAELRLTPDEWITMRIVFRWEREGILISDGVNANFEPLGRSEANDVMMAWYRIRELARCA